MGAKQIGKILWWSQRDGNGIICDPYGNEHYFDRSVLTPKIAERLDRETLVVFDSDRSNNLLVAKNIKIPSNHLIAKYEDRYKEEKTQLRLPFAI